MHTHRERQSIIDGQDSQSQQCESGRVNENQKQTHSETQKAMRNIHTQHTDRHFSLSFSSEKGGGEGWESATRAYLNGVLASSFRQMIEENSI